jgi:hypothetical protein
MPASDFRTDPEASSAMKLPRFLTSPQCLLLGGLLAAGSLQGCQTTIGGQTLPSGTYLRDDVQYFPAGPEDKLFNQRRAIEEYQAAQAGLYLPPAPEAGLPAPAPMP